MYKTRNTLIVLAYILLMTLFFFGGYAAGGIKSRSVAVVATPEPRIVQAAAVGEEPYRYEIILYDSELYLYKISGDEKELMYSHPISENIFPKEDMDELRNGVYFDKLTDAQSLLENFVS